MRRMILVWLAVVAAGCSKSSQSYFFDGVLVERRPNGETVEIPVLLERELSTDQSKVVIINHQKPAGQPRHFSTVYDFKTGRLEMRENDNVLASGTFECARSGSGLDTLTSCTYDQTTPVGDEIHGTDSYEGTNSVTFDTVYTVKKNNEEYVYSGGAKAIPEADFRAQLKQRFASSGGGCQIGSPGPATAGGGVLAAGFFAAASLLLRRRRHLARR